MKLILFRLYLYNSDLVVQGLAYRDYKEDIKQDTQDLYQHSACIICSVLDLFP